MRGAASDARAPLSGHYVDEACELKFEQPLRLHVHHVDGAHGRDVEARGIRQHGLSLFVTPLCLQNSSLDSFSLLEPPGSPAW